MNEQLKNYIDKMREQGYSDDQIKDQLVKAGWSLSNLNEFFAQTSEQAPKEAVARAKKSGKIGKFRGSAMVVRASWNLLKQDKEAVLFPVLSIVTSIIFLCAMFAVFFFVITGGLLSGLEDKAMSVIEYVFIFAVYFITFFIATFFQIGIVALAHGRVNGKDLTFKDGIRVAFSNVGKIFVWSLLSASVGLILRVIIERSKLLTRIVAAVIGAAWSIVTYFIVPVIAIENLSVKESFKKSVSIIKKTWGESLIVNISVGLYFVLLSFVGFVVFGLFAFVESATLTLITGLLLAVYLFVLGIISSTLTTIFKYVLYQYASTGTIPPGFPPEILDNAFKED